MAEVSQPVRGREPRLPTPRLSGRRLSTRSGHSEPPVLAGWLAVGRFLFLRGAGSLLRRAGGVSELGDYSRLHRVARL